MAKPEDQLKNKDMILNGKLYHSDHPMIFPQPNDFVTLKNFGYTNFGIKGIQGMTKINSSPTSKTSIISGFHFEKGSPHYENRFIVQTVNGSACDVLASVTNNRIPLADTLSVVSGISTTTQNPLNYSYAPDGCIAIMDGSTNYLYGGAESRIAAFISYDPAGTYWYDYTKEVQNTLDVTSGDRGHLHRVLVGGTTWVTSLIVGSTRPITKVNFYITVGGGNTVSSTSPPTVEYHSLTTGTWAAASGVTDTTKGSTTKSMSQSGYVSWTDVSGDTGLSSLRDKVLYYYRFTWSNFTSIVPVYHATVYSPATPVVDIWDGVKRTVLSTFANVGHATELMELTVNAATADYNASDPLTYIQFGSFTGSLAGTGTDFAYFGFTERMMGLYFSFPDWSRRNGSAGTLVIQYCNGSNAYDQDAAWTTVTGISDGTFANSCTFNHSGTVTWTPPPSSAEFKTSIGDQTEYYYYRMYFTNSTTVDVRSDYISGITAPVDIGIYNVSCLWQNRLWLLNEINSKPNKAICSVSGTNSAFNGDDAFDGTIGDERDIVAADTLFTRYGGTVYDNMFVFKKSSIYLMDGTSPKDYRIFTISDTVGCVASKTLTKCNFAYEIQPGMQKHVLIFQSAGGINVTDGNTCPSISGDIQNFFDPDHPDYINTDVMDKFKGFFDPVRNKWHWLFANHGSTTLNNEWTYDLLRKKWAEIDRGTKDLQCGWQVKDSLGNFYCYGGLSTGYIERLENGVDFDGTNIAYTFRLAEPPLSGSVMYEHEIRNIKLVSKSKNLSPDAVECNLYVDGSSTPATPQVPVIYQYNTGHTYSQSNRSLSVIGTTIGIEYTITGSGYEIVQFEPYIVGIMYRIIRPSINAGPVTGYAPGA